MADWLEFYASCLPFDGYDLNIEVVASFFDDNGTEIGRVDEHSGFFAPAGATEALAYFDEDYRDYFMESAEEAMRIWIRADDIPRAVRCVALGVAIKGDGHERFDWASSLRVGLRSQDEEDLYFLEEVPPEEQPGNRMMVNCVLGREGQQWRVHRCETFLKETIDQAGLSAADKLLPAFQDSAREFLVSTPAPRSMASLGGLMGSGTLENFGQDEDEEEEEEEEEEKGVAVRRQEEKQEEEKDRAAAATTSSHENEVEGPSGEGEGEAEKENEQEVKPERTEQRHVEGDTPVGRALVTVMPAAPRGSADTEMEETLDEAEMHRTLSARHADRGGLDKLHLTARDETITSLKKRLALLQSDLEKAREKLEMSERDAKRLAEDLEREKEKARQKEDRESRDRNRENRDKARIEEMERELDATRAQLSTEEEAARQARLAVSEAEEAAAAARSECEKVKAQLRETEAECTQLRQRLSEMEKEKAAEGRRQSDSSGELASLRLQVADQAKRLTELEHLGEEAGRLQGELFDLKAQKEALALELSLHQEAAQGGNEGEKMKSLGLVGEAEAEAEGEDAQGDRGPARPLKFSLDFVRSPSVSSGVPKNGDGNEGRHPISAAAIAAALQDLSSSGEAEVIVDSGALAQLLHRCVSLMETEQTLRLEAASKEECALADQLRAETAKEALRVANDRLVELGTRIDSLVKERDRLEAQQKKAAEAEPASDFLQTSLNKAEERLKALSVLLEQKETELKLHRSQGAHQIYVPHVERTANILPPRVSPERSGATLPNPHSPLMPSANSMVVNAALGSRAVTPATGAARSPATGLTPSSGWRLPPAGSSEHGTIYTVGGAQNPSPGRMVLPPTTITSVPPALDFLSPPSKNAVTDSKGRVSTGHGGRPMHSRKGSSRASSPSPVPSSNASFSSFRMRINPPPPGGMVKVTIPPTGLPTYFSHTEEERARSPTRGEREVEVQSAVIQPTIVRSQTTTTGGVRQSPPIVRFVTETPGQRSATPQEARAVSPLGTPVPVQPAVLPHNHSVLQPSVIQPAGVSRGPVHLRLAGTLEPLSPSAGSALSHSAFPAVPFRPHPAVATAAWPAATVVPRVFAQTENTMPVLPAPLPLAAAQVHAGAVSGLIVTLCALSVTLYALSVTLSALSVTLSALSMTLCALNVTLYALRVTLCALSVTLCALSMTLSAFNVTLSTLSVTLSTLSVTLSALSVTLVPAFRMQTHPDGGERMDSFLERGKEGYRAQVGRVLARETKAAKAAAKKKADKVRKALEEAVALAEKLEKEAAEADPDAVPQEPQAQQQEPAQNQALASEALVASL
uniref:Centrosomal protein of 70 kDa n=1 Tax=Chromera velia CCMP2878 TaxID=1169474 RepID=A0A0G4GK14_9ALVE|eukprot:Cvel_22234.t1-p1 / transcript=Cvel_22234.t1 / gene=Cvel_22234 / organism=Chromera_velia_CCMP2878 / gene_product=hypothetical protein / transcript_product=hypothetical protein / location=Cvel_scaffold2164:2552-18868(+) / protein_length=1321 / sequence_SO=supercontig / SO=protein_coding / is_pseudo=false